MKANYGVSGVWFTTFKKAMWYAIRETRKTNSSIDIIFSHNQRAIYTTISTVKQQRQLTI